MSSSVMDGFGAVQKTYTLSDQSAAEISQRTYRRGETEIKLKTVGKRVTYKVIETIEDESTGLNGYVLEHEETKEIIISFEGSKKGIDWSENLNSFILGREDYTEPEKKDMWEALDNRRKLNLAKLKLKETF